MPKKVSEIEKKEIANRFINGENIKQLSQSYKYTKLTITNQLKKFFGKDKFEILKERISKNLEIKPKILSEENNKNYQRSSESEEFLEDINFDGNLFLEPIPISTNFQFDEQHELSSKPIDQFNFPEIVYLIINKDIELEAKLLCEYPEWSFLPEDDLKRKTIKFYSDKKIGLKNSSKNQKLIKVPNPEVIKIASNALKAKGISRIIVDDSLLSL